MPKPCGFSTPHTRMATAMRGYALQRRDSGRFHLRFGYYAGYYNSLFAI